MANCQDLCTAEKCRQLEQKIENLELDLALLREVVNGHLLQPIPLAHNYNPPSYNPPPPFVTLDIFQTGENTYVFKVGVDGNFDEDTLVLEELTAFFNVTEISPDNFLIGLTLNGELYEDYLRIQPPNLAFDIFPTGTDSYNFQIRINEEYDEDTLTITHPQIELPEPIQSDLNINGSYFDERLTITVSNGNSTDSFQVTIPQGNEIINNNTIVDNTDLENQIDDLKNILQQCCNDIVAILNLLNVVKDEVTVTVSGNSYTIDCSYEEYEQQEDSPLFVPKLEITDQTIQGNGLQGIASLIVELIDKVKGLDSRVCQNFYPTFDFTTELPLSCDSSLQNQTIEEYLQTNPNLSWLQYLIDDLRSQNVQGNNLKINNNYHVYLIYMLHLIHEQQKNIISPICKLETQDTVAVVASERVINKVQGKQLIIHFVKTADYPKRTANSPYWKVQIPSPIDTLDWDTHFVNMSWQRGNLYCELELQDGNNNKINPPVSGFFQDQASADSYFDSILALTTFSQRNRKYHPNTNPQKNIQQQTTRPYRAFVTFIDSDGNVIVESKYQPII